MSAQPGDVLFVSQRDWTAFFIKLAQRFKYHGSPAARFNHVALITDDFGGLVQANQSGVERGNLSGYKGQDIEIRRPPYGPVGNLSNGESANAVLAMHELLGDSYGWIAIACVALTLLTGTRLRFGVQNTLICSGAVSFALTRANVDVGDDSDWNSPADLMAIAIAGNWMVVS